MKHASYDETCDICCTNAGGEGSETVVFENDLWFVRHTPAPYPLAGWLMMHTQRHVQGPAHFTDNEARYFGPGLRHLSRKLEEVTGALRVYTVAFGESVQHMHAHLAPRYEQMSQSLIGWGVADLYRGVAVGEMEPVPAGEVDRIIVSLRDALAADPPPR